MDSQSNEYKYGFVTEIETDTVPRGLSEETIRLISRKKNEPDWMLEYSKQEKTHAVTQKWRELEERLAKIRREKERAEVSYDHRRARKKQV